MTFDPRVIYVGSSETSEERVRRTTSTLFGAERERADVMTPDEVNEFIVDEFRARTASDQDAVVLWWGPPGSGKSSGSMYLGYLLDPTFRARTLAERVAFRAEQVPDLYDATPKGGFCQIDEAATAALLAQESVHGDQKDLIELINVVRARNVVISILIPDPSELSKSFRARRADYRFEVTMESDDVRNGWLGRRVRGRKYYMDDGKWLGFDDEKIANPFTWPRFSDADDTELRRIWSVYLPLKMGNLDRTVEKVRESMAARAERRRKARGE